MLGFNLSYCSTLLAATVKASISMTCGAGGFAISPTLSFCPVTPSNAENFALFEVKTLYPYRPFSIFTEDELQAFFDMRVQRLQRLYSERKASPYDVDQDGNTILHVCMNDVLSGRLLNATQKACRMAENYFYDISSSYLDERFFQFLQKLQDLGVPLNKTNAVGR